MVHENLFTDTFEITDLDPGGKKFDRVSRIIASSVNNEAELILDVNTEIYPISIADKISLLLATSLIASSAENPQDYTEKGLADQYDYVMHGKCYKFDEIGTTNATVYISFGGLLLSLTASIRVLDKFSVGLDAYLLIKK